MPTAPRIAVIVASTRPTRFADIPLAWIVEQAKSHSELTFEVVDLRDYPLPFFELAIPPAMAPRQYSGDVHEKLGKVLDAADGFIILTNEYNHSFPATLKNMLDHYFVELNRKPVAFAGYGNAGAARAIEQLRQVIDELDMASVRPSLNMLGEHVMPIRMKTAEPATAFAPLVPKFDAVVADLHWWTVALKTARAADEESTDTSDEA